VERRRGSAITYVVARDAAGVAVGLLPVYQSSRPFEPSLDPDVVFAGQPFVTGSTLCSAGSPGGYTNHLVLRAAIGIPDAVRGANALIETAREVASEAGCPHVLIPDLDETQARWLADVEADSTAAATREKAVLRIGCDDFDGYVAALPRKRRWQVRQERRAFAESAIDVRDEPLKNVAAEVAPLLAQTQNRYGDVADPAETEFYLAMLAMNPGAETRALVGYQAGRPVAFSVVLRYGDTWAVRAFGRDYAAPDHSQYFNLTYYEPIARAAAAGATTIDFGVGSLPAKRFRGCRLEPLRSLLIPSTAAT
jgi:predicted N-acyltransferase